MSKMTMRERMLAVVQLKPHDRVPFVQYDGLAGPTQEIWAEIGRDNMGLLRWCGPVAGDSPHCRFTTEPFEQDGQKGFRRTLHTPAGDLWEERVKEPTYGTHAARSHFVKEPADYNILMSYFRDVTVRMNLEPVKKVLADLGDDGLPHTSVSRTPYQQLWVEWVCLEDLCLHLVDEPALMDEVFALMFDLQRRQLEIAIAACRELPIPYLVFPDNITAPVIGETYFRRFCLPMYRQLTAMLDAAGMDLPVFVHMDGNLKPLWQAISESGVRGLDSFSPKPDNDTTVAEAVTLWPQMRVCLNFPSSVHLRSEEQIYTEARKILDEGGHTGRLQIQISENVPPGMWRKSFPQIVKAINDFGPPQ